MTTELVIAGGNALVRQLGALTPQLSSFHQDLLAATKTNTQRAYAAAFRHYQAAGGAFPAQPEDLAAYIRTATALQENEPGVWVSTGTPLRPNTLGQHVAALSFAHRLAGFPDPSKSLEVQMALRAAREQRGNDADKQAKPLLKEHILDIVGGMDWRNGNLADRRDAALIVLGFTGAFRRSELVALSVNEVKFTSDGLVVTVLRSKRKANAYGKAILRGRGAVCPVNLLRHWLHSAGITEGRVFRSLRPGGELRDSLSADAVNSIVKHRAEAAGVDMFERDGASGARLEVSAHSLRSGFITQMRKWGVPDWKIARVTGHADLRTLDIYNREGNLFMDNPTADLW